MKKRYTYHLVMPFGFEPDRNSYTVTARNRTEARKKVGDRYKDDTPAARYGFCPWSKVIISWEKEEPCVE